MYNLTFLVTFPIFLISAIIVVYSMVKMTRDTRSGRNIMSLGFGVWLIGIITGALVFLFV